MFYSMSPLKRSNIYSSRANIRMCLRYFQDKTALFYRDQPKAHLCNSHTVWSACRYATPVSWMDYLGKGALLITWIWIKYVDKIWDKQAFYVQSKKIFYEKLKQKQKWLFILFMFSSALTLWFSWEVLTSAFQSMLSQMICSVLCKVVCAPASCGFPNAAASFYNFAFLEIALFRFASSCFMYILIEL